MKPLLILALAATSILALGQNPSPLGSITGKVQDESGAAVPGVTVTATGPGGVTTVVTNEKGSYTLRVSAGNYIVNVVLPGFTPQSEIVQVQSSAERSLSFTLRLARSGGPIPRQFDRDRNVYVQGDTVTAQGSLKLYRGNVLMKTDSVELLADEIDFDTTTRTASVRGNVTVRVLSVGPQVVPLSR